MGRFLSNLEKGGKTPGVFIESQASEEKELVDCDLYIDETFWGDSVT